MANWWYFRDTHAATIDEQRKIAEQYVPDQRQWLGAEPHATYKLCRDLTELVYSDMEEKLNLSSADKPIRKGDIVYVSHLFVVAGTIPAIQGVMQKFHTSGVDLRIASLNYQDNDERSDFCVLSNALYQISIQRRRSKLGKKSNPNQRQKPGRPDRNVHYWTLTKEGKAVVQNYANRLINFNDARTKLTDKTPDKRSVGEKMFQRLVREYRSIRDTGQ